jgi:hypothetical protein
MASFLSLYKEIKNLKLSEKTLSIRFIIPFFPICEYQKKASQLKKSKTEETEEDMNENQKRNFWSEFLCKSKSIRFYNINSKNFYKWWNFAAIINFK